MRAVVQRVSEGRVRVGSEIAGQISKGLVVLLGVASEDSVEDAKYIADKIVNLRIFDDNDGKLNLSLLDIQGELLAVSQFTLYGDCKKGRRPNFFAAASPDQAEELYLKFVEIVKEYGVKVEQGRFRTHMVVDITNDGPVTLLLDSKR